MLICRQGQKLGFTGGFCHPNKFHIHITECVTQKFFGWVVVVVVVVYGCDSAFKSFEVLIQVWRFFAWNSPHNIYPHNNLHFLTHDNSPLSTKSTQYQLPSGETTNENPLRKYLTKRKIKQKENKQHTRGACSKNGY